MKRIITLIAVISTILFSANVQSRSRVEGISILSDCSPQFVQKVETTSYYSCNFQNSTGGYIFSVSVNDLSSDLEKFNQVRSTYIKSFLDRIEKETILDGGKIYSKSSIVDQQSLQYSEISRLDAETTVRIYTAAFILGNKAYMINLVSNVDNPNLESSFTKLIRSVSKN
jgi:hypothetical protein